MRCFAVLKTAEIPSPPLSIDARWISVLETLCLLTQQYYHISVLSVGLLALLCDIWSLRDF